MDGSGADGGVNPARAGMIRRLWSDLEAVCSKPRASGDDPIGGLPLGTELV